jgi:2-polyprenyl-6-methoxyphenol hydroxylase-like FAD-dependent oxidoreductase
MRVSRPRSRPLISGRAHDASRGFREDGMNYDCDVAIVGFGPIGQLLSGLLGAAGVRVEVFERWPDVYALPRACAVDDEGMRILQADGIAEEFERVAVNIEGDYVWTNAKGEVLLSFERPALGVCGWGSRYMMYQPDLEHLMEDKARSFQNVKVQRGWAAFALDEQAEGVTLGVERGASDTNGTARPEHERRQVRARYVVGADGANSFVRQAAGLRWIDLGFRADWLVIDFRPNDPDAPLDMPVTGQMCDPARPTSLFRRLGRYHVRWEMMLLPGETSEEMTRVERIWELLSRWVTPNDGEIVRRAVYTFRSGVAEHWRRGCILLAGDAAHLMPPFLGQGMCSGMRDATALAWRLLALLQGKLSSTVLDSYESERRQHVEGLIARAVALGKVVCMTDPQKAAERDAQFLSGKSPPLPEFPRLSVGLLFRGDRNVSPPSGELCLQGRVRVAGRLGRFDDIVGRGWVILSVDRLEPMLPDQHQQFLRRIDARCVCVGSTPGSEVFDVDGSYQKYFGALGVQAVVVRPEFYIFGAAATLTHLPTVIDDLMTQLREAA